MLPRLALSLSMPVPLLAACSAALLLSGCAGGPAEPRRIERLSTELGESVPQPPAALPLEQLVALSRQGVGADELIGRIRASGSRYRLSASQVVELANQGVALPVLDHMVSAERTRLFDEMAEDAAHRDRACFERLTQQAQLCQSQALAPMPPTGVPPFWPQPFMDCFPPRPGSSYWRCR